MGGLSYPRKPWAYGDRVSHSVYRYSCLHKLSSGPMSGRYRPPRIYQTILPYRFLAKARGFGAELEPRCIFGADSLDQ